MRLQRIKVKGFLGHQREAEVDFSDADLWLVHGANGSGKSSFWDALMYAFFTKKRGGINLTDLIHDHEPKAEICVEFILNGQIFQICCEIKKHGRNNRILQILNGGGWRTIANSDREVSDWMKKELQISPETFTSAILLQQGKADAFFDADAPKRKEVLLELLNLRFYRKLGELAAGKRKEANKEREKLVVELEGLLNPSMANIETQKNLIDEAAVLLGTLKENRKAKETEEQNAQNAKDCQDKIDEIESEQKKIAGLVERATQIEANAQQFQKLERVLLPLESFWQAQEAIKTKQRELEKFSEILQRRTEIENDFVRYEILRENLPKLHQLKKDKENLREAKNKRDETRNNLEDLNSEVEKLRESVAELKIEFDEKETAKKSIQNDLTEIEKYLHALRQMLETRSQTDGAAECAFCGSELKTVEAKARLAHKHETWEKEIGELDAEKESLLQKFSKIESEVKDIKSEWENADGNFHQANNSLTGITAKFNFEKGEVEKCQNHLRESLEKAGKWADELENLEILVGEYNDLRDLRNVSSENSELQKALAEESKVQGIVSLLESQIIEHREKIPPYFSSACENKTEFEELRRKKSELQNAETEAENLRQARERQIGLQSDLKTWRGELEKIPTAHCRSIVEVSAELFEINEKINLQNDEIKTAEKELGNLENLQKNYADKEIKLKQAAREFELWEKLAKALGKGKNGLESVLVQKAQEQIKLGANDILRRLSKMRFELDLKDVSENELEIRVQDNHTHSSRPFENFSGGEKFCVAVSLALAVGQVANKGRTAQTLIIDEGFGSLDEGNRKSLVSEFRSLSIDILQGGCVIVVSHQDDFCEAFMNRYRLGKDEQGFTEVRRNESF